MNAKTIFTAAVLASTSAAQPTWAQDAIDFGDDASEWANDGECDDPRFHGDGVDTILLAEDRMHDASDCRALYESGEITLKSPAALDSSGLDFGDDSSEWANDGECDDARFIGTGTASAMTVENIGRDASDCSSAFASGLIRVSRYYDLETQIDFGDDESNYAKNGECDDVRFTGDYASAMIYLAEDIGHDATDCREAYKGGDAIWQGNLAQPATGVDTSAEEGAMEESSLEV